MGLLNLLHLIYPKLSLAFLTNSSLMKFFCKKVCKNTQLILELLKGSFLGLIFFTIFQWPSWGCYLLYVIYANDNSFYSKCDRQQLVPCVKSFGSILSQRRFQRVTSVPGFLLIQIQISKPEEIFFKLIKKPSEHILDAILPSKLFPRFDLISQLICFGRISTLC